MASPLLAGIPISSRFAEKLGIAQEKQDQQQMTHTKTSTQEDKSWDQTLYEKSDIYRSIKDAYTAPMRAWEGEIDPYSDQGVMEAINLAGVGLTGSIPGGAKGPGSLGIVKSLESITKEKPFKTKLGEEIQFKYDEEDGTLLAINSQGKEVGEVNVSPLVGYQGGDHIPSQAAWMGVVPEYQRQGINTEMHRILMEMFPGYTPISHTLTKPGEAWAKSVPKEFKDRDKRVRENVTKIRERLLKKYNKEKTGLNEISSPIQDLEASVQEQVKQLDSTGWNRLPGAAGKRDSDVQEPFIKRIMRENPDIFKTNPDNLSEMQKFENTLRHKYKLDEKEIENLMIPMWSTILRNEKPTDKLEDKTYQNRKKTTEADPLLTAVEKLAGMIEGMNKPKTVIRDKDGRITGVA